MRYLVVLLLLAGCATPQQRAERMIAKYGPMCETIGYEQYTEGWRNCVLQQDAANRAAFMELYQGYNAARTRTCTGMGTQVVCN